LPIAVSRLTDRSRREWPRLPLHHNKDSLGQMLRVLSRDGESAPDALMAADFARSRGGAARESVGLVRPVTSADCSTNLNQN